jgi:hypothetical protein
MHIAGREATRLANEVAQREPVRLLASASEGGTRIVQTSSPPINPVAKKAPPRVKKPSKHNDLILAPAELGAHKAALRERILPAPRRKSLVAKIPRANTVPRSSRRNPDLSGHERLSGAVELAGWSGGARSCGALLESHLSVAELLDRRVLPLFMVVTKHILIGLQHGSPKRDAP